MRGPRGPLPKQKYELQKALGPDHLFPHKGPQHSVTGGASEVPWEIVPESKLRTTKQEDLGSLAHKQLLESFLPSFYMGMREFFTVRFASLQELAKF